ncbi:MAG: hypothetical protein U0S49_10525 [Rhodospirillales bacterium]|nr:hypothetical protein [Rhodospirillales bacterium]
MQEHIKITAAPPRIQYVGDGTQREFFFPFAIFKPEHVEVFLDGERLASGMTVLGAGESAGGSVVLDAAPAEGVLVTVCRRIVVERTTDFQPAGAFSARLINDEFDYLTAALQQVAADTETSLRIAATEPVVDMTLPAVPGRAGRVLAFDAGGRPRPESRDEVAGSLVHGKLRGLDGDDHPHYLTAPRAEAWMATKSLDDLRDGFAAKRYTAQEKGKLSALPGDAEANPPRVSEAEKLSGSEWEPRTFSPRDVVDLVHRFVPPAGTSGGGSNVSVHAMLVGLSADDHLHYLTSERADGWLAGKTADALGDGEANRYMRFAGSGGAETAARSDHDHAGVYEPAFTKNTAFNRNFGAAATDVAAGNHGHDAAAIASGTIARARLPLLAGDAGAGGFAGSVPAPAAGDAAAGKFLAADATWRVPAGGGGTGGVPKGTSFPASPAAGDAFYRTDLSWLFFYDGVRGKWLGELESDGAGWGGEHGMSYLRRFAGGDMSATHGILIPYDATIVGISMVWQPARGGNLNIIRNGVTLQTLSFPSTATSLASMTLDIDFAADGILAFSTGSHISTMTSPQLRCWWRRRAA